MNALILKYFCFKKLIDKEPELIKEKLEYDDSLLFSLLSFKQSAMFYSKKDKYEIYNKLNNESFIDLIIESAINLSKENDYNKLLFLYSFVIDYYVDYYITPYLSIFAKDYSLCEATNMLDSIVANQNEFNPTNIGHKKSHYSFVKFFFKKYYRVKTFDITNKLYFFVLHFS